LKVILEALHGKVAAVIMEPMNSTFPNTGFLEEVLALTHQSGALLIFDEIITGFRFAKGGAQELFGVTPDLSTFGKGLANGFPLSAVVGRRDVMMEMEEIFFSGTFGGELLSLAAAKCVLKRQLRDDVCGELFANGQYLSEKIEESIFENGLNELLSVSGHASWRFLNWTGNESYSASELRTFFMQEIFKRGVLVLSTHNVTLAHGKKVSKRISIEYNKVFYEMKHQIKAGTLRNKLQVKPLEPLFKVR
jgi:glutamate-1-semialdehyde aminotransferase